MVDRDKLGKVVREAWVRWALAQPNPKASWLVPYEKLSAPDKEADRQIGEAVAEHIWRENDKTQRQFMQLNRRRVELIEKKYASGLTDQETDEFVELQQTVFSLLDAVYVPRKANELQRLLQDLEGIEKRAR